MAKRESEGKREQNETKKKTGERERERFCEIKKKIENGEGGVNFGEDRNRVD